MSPGRAVAFGLLLSCLGSLPGVALSSELGDISGFSRELMKEWKTPGLSVVVVRNGKRVYKEGFGLESVGERRRVHTDTLFPAASLTKTFTSMLAAMLVEEGKLKWEQPVREVLQDFRLQDPLATADCNLKDLLSHRSGLGRRDGLWYRRALDSQALLSRVSFLKPKEAFRDHFDYSNLGFMLAGMMEEKSSGLSWSDLLSRRILQPLRMSSTMSSPPPPGRTKTAAAHILGPDRKAQRVQALNEPALTPALGLWSDADDLEKWLRFLLEPFHRGLITEASLSALWVPVMPAPSLTTPEIPMRAYGMGWMISSYRGRRLIFHTGTGAGSSSILVLLPGENIGIAVLSNISNSRAPEILAWRIADLLLNLVPVDWKSRLWVQEDKLRELEMLQEKQLREEAGDGGIPEDLDPVGMYENPAYGRLEIHNEKSSGLSLYFRDFTAPLRPLRDRLFIAEIQNDPLWKRLALEFLSDPPSVVLRLDGDSIVFKHEAPRPDQP